MKLGFIGLGKMGGQMVERLLQNGHELLVLDLNIDAVRSAVSHGATAAANRQELVTSLGTVIIWLMIPAQYVDTELNELLKVVPRGSILIDGGNSDYRLTRSRAVLCEQHGVQWVDVGTSGGILGKDVGFSMMVGGDASAVATIKPVITALAQDKGWHHFGAAGSGHYTKMVHNAIEYGLMQSYAEGYRLLKEGPYQNIDLSAAGEVWEHGSIIASLLNELTRQALTENPKLEGINGYVAESGETRWALETAREFNISMPSIEASFQVRLNSQNGDTSFTTKLLAAMRNKFGGHTINKSSGQ
jgi:6-phosphogluconate dehydrogenase